MTDFPHNKIGTLLRQSALLVLWLNCPEQFLRGLFLPGEFFLLPAGVLSFLHTVKFLNEDPEIDGYIIQLPLPKHIDEQKIIEICDTVTIMKDGSYRFASLSLDEDGEGCVSRWFDFIDLPEDKEYETDDIDMWCMLPWKPGMYISGVYMDGVEIQKGPQSADQFKRKA